MAKNDLILLDGVIDDRVSKAIPSTERDEVFEFFTFEQLLKFADLSPDEINSGLVDGGDDGGIDGFFVFVNDHLVMDPAAFHWPRIKAELTVWVITCKHHDTFTQAPIDKLVATLSELFDFTKKTTDLRGRYSAEIVKAREKLLHCYRTLSTRISSVLVRIVYASRGDSNKVGAAIEARARQAEAVIQELFSVCDVQFRFAGASDLVAMERKTRRYSLELPYLECFSHGETYVLLVNLDDYANFVRDEAGDVRRYLYESNVRDFVGLNRVNDDIAESLRAVDGPDFWWLNNGITILATKAFIAAKALVLDDVQIVNGLQTTESIARYFSGGGTDSRCRSVLVKVVKTEDSVIRDAIIRATNNQTEVEQQSLHATDKIQRDIEDILLRSGWYYDRRKNYYANQGISEDKIVSPLYVAAAAVGIVHRSPGKASRLKQRHLRNPAAYNLVFSEAADLGMWPALVFIAKRVDAQLSTRRSSRSAFRSEKFLKTWRYLVGLISVARLLGRFSITPSLLSELDTSKVSAELIDTTWASIQDSMRKLKLEVGERGFSAQAVRDICADLGTRFSIAHWQAVQADIHLFEFQSGADLTEDFVNRVDAELPVQPWKPGIHREIAMKFGCRAALVHDAIQELILQKRRHNQKDGVVYDETGSVIATDPDRVNITSASGSGNRDDGP